MHQIRVHLQFLGFPIVNDPLYNSPSFGPEKGKGGRLGKSHQQLIQVTKNHRIMVYEHIINVWTLNVQDLSESHTLENWVKSEEYEACKEGDEEVVEEVTPLTEKEEPGGIDETSPYFDPFCPDCRVQYKDPPPDTLVMFLHALK